MRKYFFSLFLLLLCGVAHGGVYYDAPVYSTTTGLAEMGVVGSFKAYRSTNTRNYDTAIFSTAGVVTSSVSASGQIKAKTFIGDGSQIVNLSTNTLINVDTFLSLKNDVSGSTQALNEKFSLAISTSGEDIQNLKDKDLDLVLSTTQIKIDIDNLRSDLIVSTGQSGARISALEISTNNLKVQLIAAENYIASVNETVNDLSDNFDIAASTIASDISILNSSVALNNQSILNLSVSTNLITQNVLASTTAIIESAKSLSDTVTPYIRKLNTSTIGSTTSVAAGNLVYNTQMQRVILYSTGTGTSAFEPILAPPLKGLAYWLTVNRSANYPTSTTRVMGSPTITPIGVYYSTWGGQNPIDPPLRAFGSGFVPGANVTGYNPATILYTCGHLDSGTGFATYLATQPVFSFGILLSSIAQSGTYGTHILSSYRSPATLTDSFWLTVAGTTTLALTFRKDGTTKTSLLTVDKLKVLDWNLVMFTFNQSTQQIKFYLNGRLQDTLNYGADYVDFPTGLSTTLGGYWAGGSAIGSAQFSYSDFFIYNVDLTEDQQKQIMSYYQIY